MDFLLSSLGFGGSGGGLPRLTTCEPESFTFPTLTGAEFLAVEAHVVANYSIPAPPGFDATGKDYPAGTPPQTFCNVTVAHTHPGQHDRIHTYVWLPLPPPDEGSGVQWNGVMLSVGGGGFQTGQWIWSHAVTVSEGYAAVSTDGGHATENFGNPATWALASEGNVDLYALQNFASVSLRDAAVIGKHVTAAFYGKQPDKAYYAGCSTGGRQATMLAQRWPELYDGYLAGAPALYWDSFAIASLYPHAVMAELGYVPPACELNEFSRRALLHCDSLDGVEDGVISETELCAESFDPRKLAGEEFVCEDKAADGKKLKLTEKGAQVAQTVWEGWYETNGKSGERTLIWPGLGHQAAMEGSFNYLSTTCDFKSNPPTIPIFMQWLQYFVHRTHQPVDETTFTVSGLKRALRTSRQWYNSVIGTGDADLSDLRASGAKMLMWHGLADEAIPYLQTRTYYESVVAAAEPHSPKGVDDYLRFFEAPGVAHCGAGGVGFRPQGLVDTLRAWVEEGKAPEVLPATAARVMVANAPPQGDDDHDDDGGSARSMQRVLCKYPKRARYDGKGDIAKAESFRCE
ncbi:Tannase/feruloyl esterase [Apiospora rasikravindrae]|uniref:Carboxylic ester hydrolase n=1 Tax=Apiospora rasikravindrae TaxID=990691 RepID=A0ABR1SX04_9PEZI